VANQSPDRRKILALLANAAAISQFPGFSRWTFAAEHSHGTSEPARPANYTALFFNPAEYNTIDQLAELIIPKDESPGAHEAGVVEFIDFMVAHDADLQFPFRTGLEWLNAYATEKYGSDFSSLAQDQQQAILGKLAYRDQHPETERQGQEFVALVKRYTIFGYYTSRMGLEELDYPGLKLYSASPECPHHDDPEHKHLSTGRA
jgi:gluconate 2-dehydrogenase gamma chain